MSEIFISYASEDRERVKPIVEALALQGWAVWWDRKIPFGKTFDQIIEEALEAARCVVVVWSQHSVTSEWVKNEAYEALQRHILVPVLIDDVKIPLGFRRIQAARLLDWKIDQKNIEFESLVETIKNIIVEQSILSANRLYREFRDNPIDAADKYQGKTVAVEGLVGKIIRLDHGEAAVHIPDHSETAVPPDDANRAIIANFPRQDDLRGFQTGDKIKLQCAFDSYEYNSVWMSFCTLAPPENIGPEPAIVASNIPSANLLYREYIANEKAASAKHDGTIVDIEARLGDQIQRDDGGVAIHIADRGNRRALIATFPDASAVAGIEQGELFRVRCRVKKFEYQILWLEGLPN
jgi:hypothetical protein